MRGACFYWAAADLGGNPALVWIAPSSSEFPSGCHSVESEELLRSPRVVSGIL